MTGRFKSCPPGEEEHHRRRSISVFLVFAGFQVSSIFSFSFFTRELRQISTEPLILRPVGRGEAGRMPPQR